MAALKDRLRTDLTAAMKARDEVRTRTLRSALTAVSTAEVAGVASRELSDDEVVKVLTREAKRRREAADAFAAAGRAEQASAERAEGEVLDGYLPAQLGDEELAAIVAAGIAESGASGPRAMGQVMKVVTPQVAGRADGGRVAAEVRRQLGSALASRWWAGRHPCRRPPGELPFPPPPGPPPLPGRLAVLLLARVDLPVAHRPELRVDVRHDEAERWIGQGSVLERHLPGVRGRVRAEHLARAARR